MVAASAVCKILVVAVAMVALFFPTGESVKYGLCQGQCSKMVKPTCDAWCKQVGYCGGECKLPSYYYCCCWEVPPPGACKFNGTVEAAGPSHALHA